MSQQITLMALTEYKEMEPQVEWIDAENVHVIASGFKREDMRVQVTSSGKLRVSGQRMVEGNKGSRFEKEIRIPNDCEITGITAKYENGALQIRLPRATASSEADKHYYSPQPQPQPQPQLRDKHHQDEDDAVTPATNSAAKRLREAEATGSERCGPGGGFGTELEKRKTKVVMVLVVVGALVVGYLSGRLAQAVKDGWRIVQTQS